MRIGSYNVALLGAPRGKRCYDPEDASTRARLEELAESMRELDADVLCLQEVPSEEALEQFARDYLPGYEHFAFCKTNDTNYHHLAFLSRHPLGDVSCQREGFTRGVATAQVRLGDYPVTVYNVHLRADPFYKTNPTPEKIEAARRQRHSEIEGLHQLMVENGSEMPGARYVVAGDVNAGADSSELEHLTGEASAPLVDALAEVTGWSHPVTQRRVDTIALSPALAEVASAPTVVPPESDWLDHGPVAVTLVL